MSQESNSGQDAGRHSQNPLGLTVKVILTLVSVPLACMELLPSLLPDWLSDFSYGLMFRLGLTFGLVVLIWHVRSLREILTVRGAGFWLASVASAVLARWVGRQVGGDYDILAIVISGAIFLALAQKFILGCSWVQAIAAMIAAPGLFHLLLLPLGKIVSGESAAGKLVFNYWPLYWQLGYLLGMFATVKLKPLKSPPAPSNP